MLLLSVIALCNNVGYEGNSHAFFMLLCVSTLVQALLILSLKQFHSTVMSHMDKVLFCLFVLNFTFL